MSNLTTKTRFAPSPTGLLHLGNVRTALFSWLLARREEGVFLLRIEDTDLSRHQEEAVAALIQDLRWLGLNWDEGPEISGSAGPYRQSERTGIYQHYFQQLEKQELVYPCFCSQTELAVSRKTQLAAGRPPRYSGVCARLSAGEVERRLAEGQQPTLRFRVTSHRVIEFDDRVRGPQRFAAEDIGDFVIRRADGSAAFFFTNAIDDSLMGVTDVLRGEDHLSNTPRQILILDALGLRVPRYGHIAMVVGADGAPLSKRTGSLALRSLREEGYLPVAVNNTLARLGHSYPDSKFMPLAELARQFSMEHLGRAPARFDPAQLGYWQREAVTHADINALWAWMGEAVHRQVPGPARESFVQAMRANVTFPAEALRWADIVYSDRMEITEAAQHVLGETPAGFFHAALAALEQHPQDYKAFLAHLKECSGEKGKRLFEPLRAALTGRLDGPELAVLFGLIGPERIRQRFEK
jgi:glutamyl-tRNA synthetase